MAHLFDSQWLGGAVPLNNRIVMAPITRTRTCHRDIPNTLTAAYYGQWASAGLIVAEVADVAPSSNGYAMTPGISTEAEMHGWRLVTDEVHRKGGIIFSQIGHIGRMAHPSLMPNGEARWGVTEQQAETEEVPALVGSCSQAFANARRAGFDGIEIHTAQGHLFDQLMNPAFNTRTDRCGGGSVEDRTRFLMDVVDVAVREWGLGRIGIRLAPLGACKSMSPDPLTEETLLYVSEQLGRRGVAYMHLVYELIPTDNMNTAVSNKLLVDRALLAKVRAAFPGAIIWCGSFTDVESAQAALDTGLVDLIALSDPVSQTRILPSISSTAGR